MCYNAQQLVDMEIVVAKKTTHRIEPYPWIWPTLSLQDTLEHHCLSAWVVVSRAQEVWGQGVQQEQICKHSRMCSFMSYKI